MNIPSMSIASAQGNLHQSVGINLLSMAKNQTVQEGQDLVQMMERSVQPNLGGSIDIKG
jgi:hypothetical protein